MSQNYPLPDPDYTEDMTKQSFLNETNVNKIIERHARLGTLSHLEQWGGQYGDLTGFDFQTAQNQIAKANSMFEKLPAEVRSEFSNDPGRFFEYVNDPEHAGKLAELLPALAAPGRQLKVTTPSADTIQPAPVTTETPKP